MTDDLHARLDRLEALVADQQDTIDQQQETIEDQQETIDRQRDRIQELESAVASDDTDDGGLSISRRTALTTGGLFALLGIGSGPAAADASGHLGDSNDPLQTVYTEQLAGGLTGGETVDSLLSSGLSTVDTGGDTELRAAVADTDADGLLETTGSATGIDTSDLRVRTVSDPNGNSHLKLLTSGPLNVTQSVDVNGNRVLDNGTTALDFDGNANTTVPDGNTLTTAELQVGDTSPVTGGPFGDAGELIVVDSQRVHGWRGTTDSSTFTNVTTFQHACQFQTTHFDSTNLGTFYVAWAGAMQNKDDATADVSARLVRGNSPEVISGTAVTTQPGNFTEFSVSAVAYSVLNHNPFEIQFELKSANGDGRLISPWVGILAEIE